MATEDLSGGSDNQEQSNSNNSGGSDNQQTTPNAGDLRRAGQREVLNVLSKATGQVFNNAREAAAYYESLKETKAGDSDQSNNKQHKQPDGKSSGEIAELRQMIQSLQADLSKKDTAVKQANIEAQITQAMGKNGFDPEYFDLAKIEFNKQLAFDDNGEFYVKGKDGNVRLDKNGDPFTLDLLAADIIKSRPKLAKEDARTGTGTRFGFKGPSVDVDDQPDASKDPAAWRAWATRQGTNSLKGMQVNVSNTAKR